MRLDPIKREVVVINPADRVDHTMGRYAYNWWLEQLHTEWAGINSAHALALIETLPVWMLDLSKM